MALLPNSAQTPSAALDQLRVEEVHLRAADEGADEQVGRIIVEVLRGIDLLDEAVLHDDDARAHGHGLGLVMGNVDKGRLEALMQLGDLGAHLHAELGVQVGERFVHQEDLRITHDGAAEGDALTLAAGERLRLAVEQLLDGQDLRSFTHAACRSHPSASCAASGQTPCYRIRSCADRARSSGTPSRYRGPSEPHR